MHFANRARFDDQPRAGPQALAHQVLVHGSRRQQCRNWHQLRGNLAVGDNENVVAELDRILGVRAEACQRRLHPRGAPCRRIADIELERSEGAAREQLDVADLLHLIGGDIVQNDQ